MLSARERKAARMLFEMPDCRVAEELGVSIDALRRWKGKKEFIAETQARERELEDWTGRALAGVRHNCARAMLKVTSSDSGEAKADAKLMLDFLKASGLLEATAQVSDGAREHQEVLAKLAEMQEEERRREADRVRQ